MVLLKNISKKYGENYAVKNFTHQFGSEKTTVVIGPSGCGKSTLMRLITGLTGPNEGEVFFEGEQLTPLSVMNIRRKIGYVIQEGGLFPHLTGFENISLMAKHLKWSTTEIENRVNELCGLSKLDEDLLNHYPSQLSGGQRQRIGLMRALMLDPDYLLLDEPLGALDPLVRYDLQNDLKSIFNQLNKTVIMVTHDLAEAVFFSETIILMRDGEIEQTGNAEELVGNPRNEFVKKFITAQRSV